MSEAEPETGLRIVRCQDASRVRFLDRAIFPHDEPVGVDESSAWWIAFDGKRPVGFSGVKLDREAGFIYIVRAGVLPSHCGQGIYRRLTQTQLAYGRREGAEEAITYTMASNDASVNSLIRCGFRLYTPDWAWVGRDGVLYWRCTL